VRTAPKHWLKVTGAAIPGFPRFNIFRRPRLHHPASVRLHGCAAAILALPEFDREAANTRKVLERVPEDKLDWQARHKSHTIGWNANHLAEILGWVEGVLTAQESERLELCQVVDEEVHRLPEKYRARITHRASDAHTNSLSFRA
jgi:hypothetical protein